MWWNPINSIRHQLGPKKATVNRPKKSAKGKEGSKKQIAKRCATKRRLSSLTIDELKEDPSHPAYWAEGTRGKGAESAWKFNCICGETCSSYENYRYHPVGAMYACTVCGVWSHVVCMLGKVTLEELEELEVFSVSCSLP